MKPIQFPEANVTFAEGQEEYHNLPAFVEDSIDGRVISCWRLSWLERLKVLVTGRVWSHVLTFHRSLQPQLLDVNSPFGSEARRSAA